MPRLVVPSTVAKGRFAAKNVSEVPTDGYKDRLVKYLPAESVAFYAFADKMLASYFGIDQTASVAARAADSLPVILAWLLLLLCIIGTPIYLYRQRIQGQPWKLHAATSTVAFIVWAYALGGSIFLLNNWYHVLAAGLAAPIFTFVSGWIEPKPV